MIISPSILSADFMQLEHEIDAVQNAGAKWLHIDVMDGHFVPNLTVGVPVVKSIRKKTSIFLDVHLMIENPHQYIKPFAEAGADLITFHYEACENNTEVKAIIKTIHACGKKAGISIKPKTSEKVLLPFLNEADLILIMTVEPGFGGQEFLKNCASKIPFIKENSSDKLIIQVDGGINSNTAKICSEYGANSLVAGSYIYHSSDYKKAIDSLVNGE